MLIVPRPRRLAGGAPSWSQHRQNRNEPSVIWVPESICLGLDQPGQSISRRVRKSDAFARLFFLGEREVFLHYVGGLQSLDFS